MKKQEVYAGIVMLLWIIAAATVENLPLISAGCVIGMAVALFRGRLWEIEHKKMSLSELQSDKLGESPIFNKNTPSL